MLGLGSSVIALGIFVCIVAILMSLVTPLLPLEIKAKLFSIHMTASICDTQLLTHLISTTEGSEQVRTLLNSKDQLGWTALMYSSYLQRNPDCIANILQLVNHGAWVDQQDNEGMTALHHAVQSKSTGAVEALIKVGASLNITNTEGQTAISVAAYWGRLDEARMLMEAAQNQQISIHKMTRSRNKRGRTPIMFAVLNGHKDMVTFLQVWDAKQAATSALLLDMCDFDGKNVLMLVLSDPDWRPMLGRLETVKWMIALNASVVARDNSGLTTLVHAANGVRPADTHSEEIVQLIAKQCPPHLQDPAFLKLVEQSQILKKIVAKLGVGETTTQHDSK
eukprot:c6170_g1_i1.p1 GENE.c6170_g1_i1~~c6170_g1_i1.p1  ORF type:complete len:359 (-),score=83.24 c6170_g1_i1:1159-2166(-)